MRKLHPTPLQAAALGLAALFVVALSLAASPANAGSGCAALMKAAKKGFRGDPAALVACEDAARGGAHAAKARPRALKHSKPINDARQLKAYRKRDHKDANVHAQMRGVTALRRGGSHAGRRARDDRAYDAAVNAAIILETIIGGGGPH